MLKEFIGTGRRKTAVASVRLRQGSGLVKVNGKDFETYFFDPLMRKSIVEPLELLGLTSAYDMVVRVKGGGIEGQSAAVRLGVARALVGEDLDRRAQLKEDGFLTRDSRRKERKKYGRPKARKRFQFSKR